MSHARKHSKPELTALQITKQDAGWIAFVTNGGDPSQHIAPELRLPEVRSGDNRGFSFGKINRPAKKAKKELPMTEALADLNELPHAEKLKQFPVAPAGWVSSDVLFSMLGNKRIYSDAQMSRFIYPTKWNEHYDRKLWDPIARDVRDFYRSVQWRSDFQLSSKQAMKTPLPEELTQRIAEAQKISDTQPKLRSEGMTSEKANEEYERYLHRHFKKMNELRLGRGWTELQAPSSMTYDGFMKILKALPPEEQDPWRSSSLQKIVLRDQPLTLRSYKVKILGLDPNTPRSNPPQFENNAPNREEAIQFFLGSLGSNFSHYDPMDAREVKIQDICQIARDPSSGKVGLYFNDAHTHIGLVSAMLRHKNRKNSAHISVYEFLVTEGISCRIDDAMKLAEKFTNFYECEGIDYQMQGDIYGGGDKFALQERLLIHRRHYPEIKQNLYDYCLELGIGDANYVGMRKNASVAALDQDEGRYCTNPNSRASFSSQPASR
jgi:hypothetical protein